MSTSDKSVKITVSIGSIAKDYDYCGSNDEVGRWFLRSHRVTDLMTLTAYVLSRWRY